MPIDRVPQAALRTMIAYVPQDPSMFHRSIADNIRVGRPDATDAEVRRAAELAHAAEFIAALPDGYDDAGRRTRREALRRAAPARRHRARDSEGRADPRSSTRPPVRSTRRAKRSIQDALLTLLQGRTALVIAHRLSTVRRMDELIIMDRGAIVERGSHEALLSRDGIYAGLWAHQSGGFLGES